LLPPPLPLISLHIYRYIESPNSTFSRPFD
jgi:hypothetical protein